MLYPTSIEKSNVGLANALFHESTINALKFYADEGYYSFAETAAFLQIIRDWFDVMNAKSQYGEQKSRNERRASVSFDDRKQLDYLRDFHEWLITWNALDGRGLSRETFQTARITTINFVHLANYLLDKKNVDYILFGLISQDFLEGRFGWHRQLLGGNYFHASLNFLQAERKIRIMSLVKMGFHMDEVRDIFQQSNDAVAVKTTQMVNSLVQKLSVFDFFSKFMMSDSDKATIFYTSGAIVRGFLRRNKCESCIKMLTKNEESLTILPDEILDPEHEKYVDLCNRGGLIKPSDLVYMTALHAWSLYVFIFQNSALSKLLLSSPNPRSVFVQTFTHEMQSNTNTLCLVNQTCQSGCRYQDKIEKIATATFNLKAKNYVSAANYKIRRQNRSTKKRKAGSHKKSPTARKVKKLSSS